MVLDLIVSIVTEFVKDPIEKYVILPIIRRVCYPFNYKSKVKELDKVADELENKRVRLEQEVTNATNNGEEIHENVTSWMDASLKAMKEAKEIVDSKEETAKKRCFVGFGPNLIKRYQLSKKADKKASEIRKVIQKVEGGYLRPISKPLPPRQIVAQPLYSREKLPSRVKILQEVMDSLKDPNLNIIGVYGMGGVGKTTLVKEVHRQSLADKLFDNVIMVAVSQTPDLHRIQAEIAKLLGLDLIQDDGTSMKAYRLNERLKKEKTLIILDDIWTQLRLDDVGIPSPSDYRGCKLLLSSRRQDVLRSQMGTQKDIKLEVLPDDETESLFGMTLGDAKDPSLNQIATRVSKKCAGLPLLIIKVATDLRGKDSHAWNDKLNQLSVFSDEEIQEKIHSVLKSSYDNLPSKEEKSFFLLCSLFGQSNIRIHHLLLYGIGLSLFENRTTIEDSRDRVLTLIDKLKADSLLLDGDMEGFVKMHDVVRDTAMSIASRLQHAFIHPTGSKPKKWPNDNCTRISLTYNDKHGLPERLECPKAELMFLTTEDFSLKIPDLFFEGIRRLQVLDFTGIHFKSLPSSLGFLTNLHTLCLHRCQLDNVAIVGQLKELEVLSFAESYIVGLPREIGQLTGLKLLDLRYCSKLKVIPANVLSNLTQLEALYMSNSFVEWEGEGNARLNELEQLQCLKTLEMKVLDARIIPRSLFLKLNGLQNYRILIGDAWDWSVNNKSSRTLKLKFKMNILSESGLLKLLKDSEDLYLDEVREIKNVLYALDGDGFPHLKHLHVRNDPENIQHIINSTNRSLRPAAFPILQSLFLDNIMNLENIYQGQLQAGSLGELEVLEVRNCEKLSTLFSISGRKVEDNVSVESPDNDRVVELTNLRSMTLFNLPQLRSFCCEQKVLLETHAKQEESSSGGDVGASFSLFSRQVSLPNLEDLYIYLIGCEKIWQDNLSATTSNLKSLTVWKCNNLKYLFTSSMVRTLVHLKKLQIIECVLMEEIILTQESVEESERIPDMLFPQLDSLILEELPKLLRFCTAAHPVELKSLRELEVTDCNALTTFVAYAPCTDLTSILEGEGVNSEANDNSEIQSLFDGMVILSNLEEMELSSLSNFKSIWHSQLASDSFCKLKSLSIEGCPIVTIFPPNDLPRFRSLEKLSVRSCDSLEEIFQLGDQSNVEESNAGVSDLNKIKRFNAECPNLKYLEVSGCDKAFEANGVGQPPFFFEMLMNPNLEELKIGHEDLKRIQNGEPAMKFSKLKVLQLLKLRDESSCNLFDVLKMMCNPEKLVLRGDGLRGDHLFGIKAVGGSLIELFSDEIVNEKQENFEHLEILGVNSKHLWGKDVGLESIIQHLQTLKINDCSFINIANSSSSFTNLTTLEVSMCWKLKSLVTVSTAKTMQQLTRMSLSTCYKMTQVVEDNGDYPDDKIITFNKLKILEFRNLPELTSFCSGNHAFSFPILEELLISGCNQMKIFSHRDVDTPKLRAIKVYKHLPDQQIWEGNLNATIPYLFLNEVVPAYFILSAYPAFKENWHEQRLARRFHHVETLTVDKCENFIKVVPANLLRSLSKLKKLEVKWCASVEEVFDLEGMSTWDGDVGLLPRLSELHLIDLPMLRCLWNMNPKRILEFKNLKVLKVKNCSSLKYAFTWAVALCLDQLQEVELKNCGMMEGIIIKKEEANEEVESKVTLLRSLASLVLECLPKLSSGKLECRTLKTVSIYDCPNVKISFTTEQRPQAQDNGRGQRSNNEMLLVLSNVEELSLDTKSTSMILDCDLPLVKVLKLCSFTPKSFFHLIGILQRFSTLEKLVVGSSSFKELFMFEDHNGEQEDVMILPHVKTLELYGLHELKTIWKENSQSK